MVYKYLTLFGLVYGWSLWAYADLPDICSSPEYICKEAGPGFVQVYPVSHDYYEANGYHRSSHAQHKTKYGEDGSIDVDLENLTWTAFGDSGEVIRSGHVSGGKDYCPDIHKDCRTVTGTFTIYSKGDDDCKSTRFPVGKGGAPMPYCMFFHGGYALHGSNSVPDYNASHGCVRMDPQDAQWLNESFVEVGKTQVTIHY